jgi:hypothetical protein
LMWPNEFAFKLALQLGKLKLNISTREF